MNEGGIVGSVATDDLCEVVESYSQVEGLADRCRALLARQRISLDDLPVTDRGMLASVNNGRLATAGGYVVSSGGTTDHPKFAYVPYHQGAARIVKAWRPMDSGDVMLNLFAPGRTWGAHYFYNQLANECGAFAIPMGPLEHEEVREWRDTISRLRVNVLAGTPTGIRTFLEAANPVGTLSPLRIRKAIWVGEPLDPACRAELNRQPVPVETWGNYGSIETWVIAVNTPACAPDVLHLLPGQVLELGQPRPLLTRTGAGSATQLMRYPLGDRIEASACSCEQPRGLRILGRLDDQMKFCGTLVSIGQVHSVLLELPEVAAAHLHLCCTVDENPLTAVERLVISVRLRRGHHGDANRIRSHLLTRIYDLGFIAGDTPKAVELAITGTLPTNIRTGKTERFLVCTPGRPCADRPDYVGHAPVMD
jgi:phenylacetate-coenzyme A ligase PaaK-like adenylate-forming protein